MTPQRVTLITLGVADLDRSARFYAALGWHPHTRAEGVIFYQINGLAFGLFGLADLAADQRRPEGGLGTGAATLAQNFASAAEVDAAYARAIGAGASPLKSPEKVFWGGYSGYFADPDGHVWELAMNPFWPLQGDGSLVLPGEIGRVPEIALSPGEDRQIAELLAQCFATDYGGKSYFETRHHLRLLLRQGGMLVGHMALQLRAMRLGGRLITVMGLAEVATHPDHRGKGIATRLLAAAIDEARASPAEYLLLFGVAGLYAAAGFRTVSNPIRRVGMEGARTGDVHEEKAQLLMVLPLRSAPWEETAELDLLGNVF